jgi:hypothetical protein
MTVQTFREALVSEVTDGTQISNTTTETIIYPDYTFPAGYFYPGRTIKGIMRGVCSNVVTTPGTLIYRIRIGTATLSTTSVTASAALGLDTTARTNWPWELNFTIVCRTAAIPAGTGGTILVAGKIEQMNVLSSTAANLLPQLIPASGTTTSTINTRVANLLSVSAQFSVATSPTNLTGNTYLLEACT